MPILMEEPLKFLLDPEVQRFGAILKNTNTGKIVGHLKETGEMGHLLTSLPSLAGFNPAFLSVDLIDRGIKTYQIGNVQKTVDQIQQTVEGLQLATNIAAWSSVANLGVSVAGFTIINQKLERIDSKIDVAVAEIEKIRKTLDRLELSWQAMSTAQLQRAAESIVVAEQANSAEKTQTLLRKASEDFSLRRHYYSNLLRAEGVFDEIALSPENLEELIARYTFCCMGLLHAEFSAGDLGSYGRYLESITQEYRDLVCFNPKDLYLARSDQLDLLAIGHDHKQHSAALVELSSYAEESANRIDSFKVELEYIEKHDLTADGYMEALREHDTDIILLPR